MITQAGGDYQQMAYQDSLHQWAGVKFTWLQNSSAFPL